MSFPILPIHSALLRRGGPRGRNQAVYQEAISGGVSASGQKRGEDAESRIIVVGEDAESPHLRVGEDAESRISEVVRMPNPAS